MTAAIDRAAEAAWRKWTVLREAEQQADELQLVRDEALRQAYAQGMTKRQIEAELAAAITALGGDPTLKGLGIGYHTIRRIVE